MDLSRLTKIFTRGAPWDGKITIVFPEHTNSFDKKMSAVLKDWFLHHYQEKAGEGVECVHTVDETFMNNLDDLEFCLCDDENCPTKLENARFKEIMEVSYGQKFLVIPCHVPENVKPDLCEMARRVGDGINLIDAAYLLIKQV